MQGFFIQHGQLLYWNNIPFFRSDGRLILRNKVAEATFWKKHLLLIFLLVISILLNGCENDADRAWNQKINSVYKAYTGANDGDVTDELNKLDAREMNILFDSILSESNGVSTSVLLNIDAYFLDNSFVFSKKECR